MIHTRDVFVLSVSWRTKLVLLAMMEESGWRAEYAPCIARLAWKTGLEATIVEKCLADLREAGALLPVPRRQNGAELLLRVELAALPKRSPFRGSKRGSC